MRYIVTASEPVTIEQLSTALSTADARYAIAEGGDLTYRGEVFAQVEVNQPGDGLFEEEREELLGFLEDAEDQKAAAEVKKALNEATAIVAVRVLWGDRGTEATLDKLEPLWGWLFENRNGLLQADDEGYYDAKRRQVLVLE